MKNGLIHTAIAIVLTIAAVLSMEAFRNRPKHSKPNEALIRLEKAVFDREIAEQKARVTKDPVDVVNYERALARADQLILETSSIPGSRDVVKDMETKIVGWRK